MAVLRICCLPEPILRKKCRRVAEIDKSTQKLIDDMIETLGAAAGAGLAAPQVGKPLRVVVIQEPEKEEALVLINPEVLKRGGERVLMEGCLSIPGYQGEIKRSEWVKVKAKDRQGKEFRVKGEGLLGQALEHEIDHLNGILYIDRLESQDKLYKISDLEAADEDEEEELETAEDTASE
jgi:peptide deformylase